MAPPYPNKQRTFIVETYLQTKSPTEFRRRFAAQFPQANFSSNYQAILKKSQNSMTMELTIDRQKSQGEGAQADRK